MKIYVMRHSSTIWNEKGITQGQTQNRLSKLGIEQAKQQAEKFKNVNLDLIFVSPLMRARQTAKIMNKFHNVKQLTDKRLTELNQGSFTGRAFSSLTQQEKEIKQKMFNGSCKERYDNIVDFLKYIKQNFKDKTLLVVTHGINASFIDKIIKNIKFDLETYSNFNFLNAEIREYEI